MAADRGIDAFERQKPGLHLARLNLGLEGGKTLYRWRLLSYGNS